jgi:hypothetical protein
MKKLIQILFFFNLAIFFYGAYLQYVAKNPIYSKVMGSGVLFLVFILLPLFLWYRYKDKKIEDFQFNKNTNKKNQ